MDQVPSSPGGRSRRVRRKTQSVPDDLSTDEQLMIRQAIENSKLDTGISDGQEIASIPPGAVYHPTVEEFKDPLVYIAKIRKEAEQYGICKVVPPPGWNPPCHVDMSSGKRFETKRQLVHKLQQGITFDDGDMYTPAEYQSFASDQTKRWKEAHYPDRDMTLAELEKDYWSIVETGKTEYVAEYGNDIDCTEYWSGFPLSTRGRSMNGTNVNTGEGLPEPEYGSEEYYRESWWNLNNISNTPGSVLRHVRVPINGVNVPWLYMGTLFSTFCWHNEDNYLYSINYHHKGSPKQWYGVPGTKEDADGLEKVFKNFLMQRMKEAPDLLHHITTMFSPILLRKAKIPVCKLVQFPGEFIVTFPRSFHGGFSYGPNIGEAVNFATPDWIQHGAAANERYRVFARPSVFSHDRLTFTICQYLEEHSVESLWMLKQELNRVILEEEMLRNRLALNGIENVTSQVDLPRNRVDKLDEQSADYDDKRLCSSCKHVCFFSAVACRCSKSRVSCLRHSNQLCSCHPRQKFLLTWATTEEMRGVLGVVNSHYDKLVAEEKEAKVALSGSQSAESGATSNGSALHPPPAPAVKAEVDDFASRLNHKSHKKRNGDWIAPERPLSKAQMDYVKTCLAYCPPCEPALPLPPSFATPAPLPHPLAPAASSSPSLSSPSRAAAGGGGITSSCSQSGARPDSTQTNMAAVVLKSTPAVGFDAFAAFAPGSS